MAAARARAFEKANIYLMRRYGHADGIDVPEIGACPRPPDGRWYDGVGENPMTPTHAKLNEYNHAEEPARVLLERLGWTYVPRESLAEERNNERETLLKSRLRKALLRLNEWMTEEQAERVIFDLEHVDTTGMARNRAVHEYLNLRHAHGRRRTGPGDGHASSASSTSTIPKAVSTNSSSQRSSASAAATSAAKKMTNAW